MGASCYAIAKILSAPGTDSVSRFGRYLASVHRDSDPLWALSDFEQICRAHLHEFRSSSYIAFCDAYVKDTTVMKTNMLQILQHIPDLPGMIPDIRGASDIFRGFASGNVHAVGAAADYLTSEILRMRFSRDPTLKYAKDAMSLDLRRSVDTLTSFFKVRPRVVRGIFNYTFDAAETTRLFPRLSGLGTVTLQTRAKVSYSTDLTTLTALLLVGDSIGALPTFSRIWEILPFSFVSDWLFNSKQRLRVLDIQTITMALMRFRRATYSYKVVFTPSASTLESFGLVGSDFSLSHYSREVSKMPPILRDNSQIDFLRVTTVPDLVTVGAFVFQLVT